MLNGCYSILSYRLHRLRHVRPRTYESSSQKFRDQVKHIIRVIGLRHEDDDDDDDDDDDPDHSPHHHQAWRLAPLRSRTLCVPASARRWLALRLPSVGMCVYVDQEAS